METIPSSSTFRRLPTLNRPFRRDKSSVPSSTAGSKNDDYGLQPPSRSSSLPTSSTPDPLDLEAITYPVHLAQNHPPERQRELTLAPSIQVVDRVVAEPRRRPRTAARLVEPPRETHRLLQAQLPNSTSARASASSMYFSTVPAHGHPPDQPLRAHTGTLIGDRIWFLGGVDGKHCWRRIAWFDTETLLWSTIETFGDQLPPLRAHTTTLVGKYLYIFGGGDGPSYNNDVWLFNTSGSHTQRRSFSISSIHPSQGDPAASSTAPRAHHGRL